jgi:ABC-type branched-subunit amino acid transport system ATPase component
MSDLLLDAQGISVVFGGLTAVNNVDFQIPKASIVALIGPNGAGKTTFFNVLTGLYAPTTGTVMFDDQKITARPPHEIAASGMARTFQNIRLFGAMTAAENVMVAMHPHMKSGVIATVLCSSSSVSAAWTKSSPRTFPTATSVVSKWPAPWRCDRSCCCWMSRQPA